MEAIAITRYTRGSARKIRLVADEIRGYSLPEAMDVLKAMPQKGADLIFKTLYSAGANAKVKNPAVNEETLYIKKITIDDGPMLKRFRPKSRGRAGRIRKRTSTILVVLSDEN